MAPSAHEFKASAVFVQNISAGIGNATAKLAWLKRKALRQPTPKRSSTGTPKTTSSAAPLPVGIIKKKSATPRSAMTPKSCMSAGQNAQTPTPLACEEGRTPKPRRHVSFHLATTEEEHPSMSGLACKIEGLVDEGGCTPTPRRSMSNASISSVASQGPCHMVLLVAPTPKNVGLEGGRTPRDSTINFGV